MWGRKKTEKKKKKERKAYIIYWMRVGYIYINIFYASILLFLALEPGRCSEHVHVATSNTFPNKVVILMQNISWHFSVHVSAFVYFSFTMHMIGYLDCLFPLNVVPVPQLLGTFDGCLTCIWNTRFKHRKP